MAVIIEKNKEFFEELTRFNPKLARILEEEHGWTDKLVYRSDNGSLSQSQGRREGTQATGNNHSDKKMVPKEMGRN